MMVTKTKSVTVELIVKIPNLIPENAKVVIRDVRRTLENCGRLNLLNEFTETLMVEDIGTQWRGWHKDG